MTETTVIIKIDGEDIAVSIKDARAIFKDLKGVLN